ncbi:chorismate-binding protein [Bacillus cereus]|uniref:chorismate-binding protein n=1 Tax=Bacillus cereus TaxID=1396 RepID=UPI000A58DF96|nr:chorismate-binding protein [Bacillus cereus]
MVIAEEEGDSITPISLYRRMKGKKKFLLESSQLHQDKGRYSYLGCNPYGEVKSVGTEVERTIYGRAEKLQSNVLQVLEEIIASAQVDSPFPFCGGAVGYIGYDVIRQYENIGADLHDPLNIPEVHLLLYREFIVYDHLRQKLSFVYVCREDDSADYEEVYERLQVYKEEVLQGEEAEVAEIRSTLSFTSSITEREFCVMVETAKEHIGPGHISSCIISAFAKRVIGDPFALYRKLRMPSITIYVLYRFSRLCCTRFLRQKFLSVREDKVMTNPIAGTRPRGKTKQEDTEIEKNVRNEKSERSI